MSDLEIVPATPELVRAFYGKDVPFTFRGHVALVDGKPLGIGGISFVTGCPVAFSDWKEELSRKDRARCFRFMAAQLAEWKRPLFAGCTAQSRKLLERLGFTGSDDHMTRGARP